MTTNQNPLVIGIAGGTASGKTTVANAILDRVGSHRIAYIPHDAYYKDLQKLPAAQKAAINFDHPDSLESDLLRQHILTLRSGEGINLPIYDFVNHTRTDQSVFIPPQGVILVEGILIFAETALRELFDVKIFVDIDPDLRFIRRLQRDINERGRSTESVIHQYLTTVRPMHLKFVEPSKRYADVIIPEGGYNNVALDMVVARVQTLLEKSGSSI
jgi:uridine kinase